MRRFRRGRARSPAGVGSRNAFVESERNLRFGTRRTAEESAVREVWIITRALEDVDATVVVDSLEIGPGLEGSPGEEP